MCSLEIGIGNPQAHERAHSEESPGQAYLDDSALLRAALADRREFAALYHRYVGRIFRYCILRLDSAESAEDITSEVFVRALSKLDTCSGDFAAWLFQITRNAVADRYRRRQHLEPLGDKALQVADVALGPEMLAEKHFQLEALRRAVLSLPEEQRTVLEMQLAGWQGEAIARALGRSTAAVKMLRYRAVNRLREFLVAADTPQAQRESGGAHARPHDEQEHHHD
jgi:RNA polymerase sigma-70 factor (ECF subfamily)